MSLAAQYYALILKTATRRIVMRTLATPTGYPITTVVSALIA